MRITKQLKEKLQQAQSDGYRRVYTVIGACRGTTYCRFYNIADLLDAEVGTEYRHTRPAPRRGMWTGVENSRHVGPKDIMYHDLFWKYRQKGDYRRIDTIIDCIQRNREILNDLRKRTYSSDTISRSEIERGQYILNLVDALKREVRAAIACGKRISVIEKHCRGEITVAQLLDEAKLQTAMRKYRVSP